MTVEKTMNKLFLFFMFLFAIPLVSSYTDFACFSGSGFSDDFSYSDAFTNHGWVNFDNGICSDAAVPPKPNITNTFGYALTGCGTSVQARLDSDDLSLDTHNSSIFFSFDFEIDTYNPGDSGILPITAWICDSPFSTSCMQFGVYGNASMQITSAFTKKNEYCSLGQINYNKTTNLIIEFNTTAYSGNGSFSVYIDHSPVFGCRGKNLGGLLQSMTTLTASAILFHGIKASTAVNQYIDNFNFCDGIILVNETNCVFPSLFCDQFNYNARISTRGWIPYGIYGFLDDTINPINNTLLENTAKEYNPTHTTGTLPITYNVDAQTSFVQTKYAAVFSSEMDLRIVSGGFTYTAGINEYASAYTLRAIDDGNGTVSWKYLLPNASYAALCDSCTPINQTGKLKINMHFKAREKYPFNTSNTEDFADVFFSSQTLGKISGLLNNAADYLSIYTITKEPTNIFMVDNYYVMAGIDKDADTTYLFYNQLYQPANYTEPATGQGSGDLFTDITNFWQQLGLKSAASRIIFGFILLFVVTAIVIGLHLSTQTHISPVTIVLVDFIVIIIEMYMGLIPVWLIIMFAFILFIGFGLSLLKMIKGGSSD